jgi:hypothetical protein
MAAIADARGAAAPPARTVAADTAQAGCPFHRARGRSRTAGTCSRVPSLLPLLPGAPSCAVLITSRSGLGGLVARQGVRRVLIDVLAPTDARLLLQWIVGPERADAKPGAVALLAEVCAHHPLPLRVAAERFAATSCSTVRDVTDRSADECAMRTLSQHSRNVIW